MKHLIALLALVIAFALAGLWQVEAQPGYDLSQVVLANQLGRANDPDSTVFRIAGASAKDSTQAKDPFTYTSVLFQTTGDSVDVWVYASCGRSQYMMRADSLHVTAATVKVWMPNIPVSSSVRFAFHGSTDNGSQTEIWPVYILRQW